MGIKARLITCARYLNPPANGRFGNLPYTIDEVPGTFLDKSGYDFRPTTLGTSLLNFKCQAPSAARNSAYIFDILIPAYNGRGKIEKRIPNQEWRLFIPAARTRNVFYLVIQILDSTISRQRISNGKIRHTYHDLQPSPVG